MQEFTAVPLKYWLETYGCQMNFAESNSLESTFLESGLIPALYPEEADIVILNTCSVRQTAENRIWGRLGFFQHIKENRNIKIILTGCMAERLGEDIIKRFKSVDHVLGTYDKLEILETILGKNIHKDVYEFSQSYYHKGDFKSFVPIMNGCNNFCTYCIVPYVRGREISRSPESIIEEISYLSEKGVKEITFLGQNVNSYHFQNSDGTVVDFPDLLELVLRNNASIPWFRFMSPHPKDFSSKLIDIIRDSNRVCSHIHLPFQSGSSKILDLMNRKYSRESYLKLVETMKKKIPDITFSTDILVGFPDESDEDFEDTLTLMENVSFLEAFMYYYNPREGTKAVNMPNQVEKNIKLERLQQVIYKQKNITQAAKQKRLGKIVTVLCESISKKDDSFITGRTEHNEMIVFKSENTIAIGDFVTVRISSLSGNTFKGELI